MFSSAGQQVDLKKRPLDDRSDAKLIKKISEEFFSHDLVNSFAIHLLDGVGKGGYAYLQMIKGEAGGVPNPVNLAYKVLQEWITKRKATATRSALYEVLEEVNPAAAYEFKSELLGDM